MKVPIEFEAISEEAQQLADKSLVLKILLEFEAERLKEHMKPTGVEVKQLEMLASSLEAERLVYGETTDSHRVLKHMNHTKAKVIARRIKIERLLTSDIQRKPPEEVLQVEILKHVVRNALAPEEFHGHAVLAIDVLFENPLRVLMCTLSIRTCAESPAMLTKQRYEEWGKRCTVHEFEKFACGDAVGTSLKGKTTLRQVGREGVWAFEWALQGITLSGLGWDGLGGCQGTLFTSYMCLYMLLTNKKWEICIRNGL
ncbi:hypothetical protein F5J12DRAFT_781659 [Pisolithus orientalis]|uniref:uncharacterized protein n=1 Tax=Pisolithus orientalis TaxID=936130 RepID=UPI0022245933|nr:uncharacterized protein F5J12DRAFT_781659 [Pisolithus orientalis]KAI6012801.1 hypothetical protein F5J12DRAFT_781659 [Pisolithus orientalis]